MGGMLLLRRWSRPILQQRPLLYLAGRAVKPFGVDRSDSLWIPKRIGNAKPLEYLPMPEILGQ